MTTASSVAEYAFDGVHYPGLLFTDAPPFCPETALHHGNGALPSQIR